MQDRIIDKIRKLLALAGNNPNRAEALAAAAKAQALLMEHKLTVAEIPEEQREEVDQTEVDLGGTRRSVNWRRSLYHTLSPFYFCKILQLPRTLRVAVVGKASHVEVLTYTYVYVARQIERLYIDWARARGLGLEHLRSFAFGAILEVARTLEEQAVRQAQQGQTNALIVTENQLVLKKFKQLYPRTINNKSHFRVDSSYLAGREAGRAITIRPGVIGSAARQLT